MSDAGRGEGSGTGGSKLVKMARRSLKSEIQYFRSGTVDRKGRK